MLGGLQKEIVLHLSKFEIILEITLSKCKEVPM